MTKKLLLSLVAELMDMTGLGSEERRGAPEGNGGQE